MPRSFKLPAMPAAKSLKEPQVLVRAALGILLAANLVAAAFAFNLIGQSPEALNQQLIATRSRLQAQQLKLTGSRHLAGNIDTGKSQSESFLNTYMMERRRTYSTIIGDLRSMEKESGMTMKELQIAPLDPIEGSDDLSMMTISFNFNGTYPQLVKFVNLLDRSPRFLIIESMTAAPEAKGDVVTVNLKLNAFVRDDGAGGAVL